ncbi:Coumaroyl-CoA\\x3aanthocyanidin 3-O-glucoside-6-O-coumaroyltransferase 2 [Striga hermonthica]|uniref:Coumaroyl-CoA\x3aanthocyanidin 3-O-glucoside-6-O-coumaroyltransferase 2 n=1 Tax=Striga hermonthica TaxID=68872 RepID=A0A9N7P4Q2_STRHE|nr:Coumaroyl-CoA\\x3aanthocyanidin 3-O-glucoside-6-O-coumaroyltransferase 2 [Striga hermonthica]
MSAPGENLTVLCRTSVSPSTGAAADHRLPLTFFDILWLYFHPIQRLLLYPYPCSTDTFLQKIAPNLKNSLSKTLNRYLPLAGNLIVPQNSDLPELLYSPGDSVLVTFAESNGDIDFSSLTGNHPRNSDQFHSLVPDFPDPKSEIGFVKIPVLAVQITLFPQTGISIGITNHHSSGDASSIVGFIKTWSSYANLAVGHEIDNETDNENLLPRPIYDRSLIKDPLGLTEIFWAQMRADKIGLPASKSPPNKLRATFVLRKHEIEMLKNLLTARNPGQAHISSFTVIASYVWACLSKSIGPIKDDEPEYFVFAVDARGRVDPPLPEGYFGNCVAAVLTDFKHGDLRSENGFFEAAKVIGEVIANKVNNKEELFRGADEWLTSYGPLLGKRLFGVAGSPRFDLYDGADFGLGKPKKYEAVSIDWGGSMSLCKSREFEGGLEIGLSLVKEEMDAFVPLFYHGLKM